MIITNSNASHCHVNTKVQSTDLVQMKNMNFRVCVLVRLLFGHQAVNPYRVNTACAPMAAYTWSQFSVRTAKVVGTRNFRTGSQVSDLQFLGKF